FKGLVASGWHMAALAMRLLVEGRSFGGTPIIGVGVDALRWLQPVRPGDVLTLERTIAEIEAPARPGGRGALKSQVEMRNQGVAGTLAATALMNARPDGYTLAQVTNTLVRQPFIAKTSYDPAKDFTYVIGITAFEFGLAVRTDAPWKTLDEFIAYARANPGKI